MTAQQDERGTSERREDAGSTTRGGMTEDQFGDLVTAILTAGTLAASHRGVLEAKAVPTHFFQMRSELRAAGLIHRHRTLGRRGRGAASDDEA